MTRAPTGRASASRLVPVGPWRWCASLLIATCALLGFACTSSQDGSPTSPSTTLESPAGAGSVTVRFDFEASSFGGGPNRRGSSPGAPIREVSGNLTIAYAPDRIGDARLTSFSVRAGAGSGSSAWGPSFTPSTMRLEILRPDGPSQARAMQVRLTSTTSSPSFTLAFEFPATNPTFGSLQFVSATYRVRGDNEIYQARSGVVTATLVAPS